MIYDGEILILERYLLRRTTVMYTNYGVRNKFNARTRVASLNGRRDFNNRGIPVKGVE